MDHAVTSGISATSIQGTSTATDAGVKTGLELWSQQHRWGELHAGSCRWLDASLTLLFRQQAGQELPSPNTEQIRAIVQQQGIQPIAMARKAAQKPSVFERLFTTSPIIGIWTLVNSAFFGIFRIQQFRRVKKGRLFGLNGITMPKKRDDAQN